MPRPKIIYHYPGVISRSGDRATAIRPGLMLEAFEAIGYDVELVSGEKNSRKKSIHKIKKLIKSGVEFEFLYSENLTIPLLLSEPNHIPISPSLDYGFFWFLKKNNIPIGIFYRDIYWLMDGMVRTVFYKKLVLLAFHYLDLWLNKIFDIVFLPTKEMYEYIPLKYSAVRALPPGMRQLFSRSRKPSDKLRIVYVGGFNFGYRLDEFLEAVRHLEFVSVILILREDEYRASSFKMPQNCKVVHAKSDEIATYLFNADLGCLALEPQQWRSFAFPFKAMEYLAHSLPILVTEGNPVARFVSEYEVGVCVEYNRQKIAQALNDLWQNKKILDIFSGNIAHIAEEQTWRARAIQVADGLKNV